MTVTDPPRQTAPEETTTWAIRHTGLKRRGSSPRRAGVGRELVWLVGELLASPTLEIDTAMLALAAAVHRTSAR